jgi:hypothetical protein
VAGDLTINSGALAIELGGSGPGEFDQLVVDGAATLGGSLDVSLLDGFALEANSVCKIIDIAGARAGEFAGLGEGALVGDFGESLFITYAAGDGNDVALYTAASHSGDFDEDGDTDGADLLKWQGTLGSDDSLADGNDDGIVDGDDLQIWADQFGASATAAGTAVPEPSAAWLLALAVTLIRGGAMQSHSVVPSGGGCSRLKAVATFASAELDASALRLM